MIFNQQGRSEAVDFLDFISSVTERDGKPAFDRAIFCTNVTYAETGYKRDFVNHQYDPNEVRELVAQRRFAEKWTSLDPAADIQVVPTIEEAINSARDLVKSLGKEGEDGSVKVDAFVTGSLHLVGGALGILEKADAL